MVDDKKKTQLFPDTSMRQFLVSIGLTGLVSVIAGRFFPKTLDGISPTERFSGRPKIVPLNDKVAPHQYIQGELHSDKPSFWEQAQKDFVRGVMDGLVIYVAGYLIQESINAVVGIFKKKETHNMVEENRPTVSTSDQSNSFVYRNDWQNRIEHEAGEQKQKAISAVTPTRG